MKCPRCGDELIETSKGRICLNCGYNEFSKNMAEQKAPVKTAASGQARAAQPAAEPNQLPAAEAEPMPEPPRPTPAGTAEPIWFRSFNPVSGQIGSPQLRRIYANINLGWYPVVWQGWLLLAFGLATPALAFLFFGRLGAAVGLVLAALALLALKNHFERLILPWRVPQVHLKPPHESTFVTIGGQLYFRIIVLLTSAVLFAVSLGTLAIIPVMLLALISFILLCFEIYEFMKQV